MGTDALRKRKGKTNKITVEKLLHPPKTHQRVRKNSNSTSEIEKHKQETKEIAIDVKFNLKPMIISTQANKQIITKTILNIDKEYIFDLRKTRKGPKDLEFTVQILGRPLKNEKRQTTGERRGTEPL